jgi:type IV secretion system protein VirD4
MGNSIIVTFGNFPLRTKYTPSFKCKLYKFGTMDLTEIRSNVFYSDEVYYDLEYRNSLVLKEEEEEEENKEEAGDGNEA